MKNLFILLFLAAGLNAWSQVAINTDGTNPDNSAMLDVKSTEKGVLLPRMTTTEREAIASPAAGLTVYDLTTQGYWYYNGTAWATIGNGPWTANGNDIYSNITGKAGIGTNAPDDKLHLYDSVNLRLLIETPDNLYAGVRTRNSQREYFMGTIGDRWSVFDNYADSERISVLPDGNIGIATTTPDPSALLDVSSTSKGFLPPRMTTVQRDLISSPATGLTIYNTTKNGNETYNGTSWVSSTHFIGESYGGGIVFYLYDSGQHGLIAATADQSSGIQWYNGTFRTTGTSGDGLNAGAMNTAIIVATQMADNQSGNFAAKVCADYSVTMGGITYGDWYLPSKYELNLLFM